MKFNKTLTTLLTFGIIFASLPANTKAEVTVGTATIEQTILSKYDYTPFLGTIERIQKKDNEIDYIKVKDSDGEVSHFKNGTDTSIIDDIKVGDNITVFYNKNLPHVAIFPLQQLALAVIKNDDNNLVMLSKFNHNLISKNKDLKLNIDDTTKIVDVKGEEYTGTLVNRDLIVYYNFATKSIPAQTTPSKIIVLNPLTKQNNNLFSTTSSYLNLNATIKDIKTDGDNINYIVDEDGSETILVTNKDTFFANKKSFQKDDEVTAFVDASTASVGVYPPKYNISAISEKFDGFIKADSFDKNLVSRDNSLKLSIYNSSIEITDKKGDAYTGTLENKKLLVFYKNSSRSIPAETTPERIVVLGNADNFDITNIKFNDLSGKITKIENSFARNDEKTLKLFLTNDDENENIFIVDKDTHLVNDYSPKVGDKVIVNTSLAPSVFSYPPQYSTFSIARANPGDNIVKTTIFDGDNLSFDKKLKLNLTDDVDIVTKDGKTFSGDIKNKLVTVEYIRTTRSIPPIASPIKITVLNEFKSIEEVPTPYGSPASIIDKVNSVSINGTVLTSDDFYVDSNGTIMVKLRSLTNAINKDLDWVKETKTSIIEGDIKINYNQSYFNMNNKKVNIDSNVVLKDGSTFVPSDFFTKAFDYKIENKDGILNITKE